VRGELDVPSETADTNDEESKLLQAELQHCGMQRRCQRSRLYGCGHTIYKNANTALRVVNERRADQRAEGGVKKTDEMLGREMREE
jgi:hypothetical protein